MANTSNPNGFRAVKSLSGAAFRFFSAYTKSNLTLAPGDAVIQLTNGTLDIAITASTGIFGVCQTKVTAVAATRQKIMFIPASEDIVWSAQYSASATPGNWSAGRDIGGATGAMLLTSTTAVAVARMIGYEPLMKNEAGAYARVLFVWTKSQWSGQA